MSFDLSSASSDDTSVIDISALLPGGKNEKIDSSENKTVSYLQKNDVSSKINNGHTFNHHEDITINETYRSESKHITTTATKQSSEKSTDGIEDCEAKGNYDAQTVRMVMGETVKTWRNHRNNDRNSNFITQTLSKIKPSFSEVTSPDDIDELSYETKYVVVHQIHKPSDREGGLCDIDFENAHVNVHRSCMGSNFTVDIIAPSSTRESPEYGNDQKKKTCYSTKKCKRQFSQDGNESSRSSVFVDCIAIWDHVRQVYVLEVPEIIANDITATPLYGDNNNIATTRIDSSPFNSTRDGCNGTTAENLASRRWKDPLAQQRQAETKLLSHRKRRRS